MVVKAGPTSAYADPAFLGDLLAGTVAPTAIEYVQDEVDVVAVFVIENGSADTTAPPIEAVSSSVNSGPHA